jgi:coenzyme F420-0:L-glutamate ligase/coenzyme F420-1:gamma-L-glutamate ligase
MASSCHPELIFRLTALTLNALPDIGEIEPGCDLAAVLGTAMLRADIKPRPQDVLVVAQKVVSKAENRYVDLESVQASPRAQELSAITGKDPRLVELVLAESSHVVRAARDVLIVRHRLGFVTANAGI